MMYTWQKIGTRKCRGECNIADDGNSSPWNQGDANRDQVCQNFGQRHTRARRQCSANRDGEEKREWRNGDEDGWEREE